MRINSRYPDRFNFRDLGGLPVRDGRHVREGIFFRSGALTYLKSGEITALQEEGIRFILDLRTASESARNPDPDLPGVLVIRHSGMVSAGGGEIDFSPAGMGRLGADGLDQLRLLEAYYRAMPFANEAFRTFFRHVLDGDVPVLFHCATGKDRTGVLAMVVLLALGAAEETALADYMESAVFRRQPLKAALSADAEIIAAHPEHRELIVMKEAVSERIGRAVLSEIRQRCGTPEAYMEQEYGLDGPALKAFRDRFTR